MRAEIGTPAWAAMQVRSVMDRLARANGLDPRTIGVDGLRGPVQPRVKITMPWHPYADLDLRVGEYALQPGPSAQKHAEKIAKRHLIPHLRLLARDRQLLEVGFDVQSNSQPMRHFSVKELIENMLPTWAYTISPVALAWLLENGRTPEWIIRTGLHNACNRTHSEVNGCDFELHGAAIKGFSLDIGKGVRWRDDQYPTQIQIKDQLPQSVLMALRQYKGKPLANILRHPVLDQVPLIMNGMGRKGIVVERPDDVTLAPVPDFLGTPWNMIDIKEEDA